jgi:hypothetical protein
LGRRRRPGAARGGRGGGGCIGAVRCAASPPAWLSISVAGCWLWKCTCPWRLQVAKAGALTQVRSPPRACRGDEARVAALLKARALGGADSQAVEPANQGV